jgi:uncharacterized OB-fold protein
MTDSLPQSPRIHVPFTLTTARELRATVQRLKAQAALINAQYQRWSDVTRCQRCGGEPAPGGVYCAPCEARIDECVRLAIAGAQ